jgi:hypothetical protein
MAKLVDVMVYLCSVYPRKSDLSNARLTKLIYLADWKFALKHGRQITNIEWVFDQFGPFVFEVKDVANDNPEIFTVENTETIFGTPKMLIKLKDGYPEPVLDVEEKEILDWVIEKSKRLPWNEFIRLIYSTYPILSQDRGTSLDLVKLADEYRKMELIS